jgi:hypothetical protein
MHLEDLPRPMRSGRSTTIWSKRPAQRAGSRMSGRFVGDEDDVVLHLEVIHLDEQLVQRLLALVVAAAETAPR